MYVLLLTDFFIACPEGASVSKAHAASKTSTKIQVTDFFILLLHRIIGFFIYCIPCILYLFCAAPIYILVCERAESLLGCCAQQHIFADIVWSLQYLHLYFPNIYPSADHERVLDAISHNK